MTATKNVMKIIAIDNNFFSGKKFERNHLKSRRKINSKKLLHPELMIALFSIRFVSDRENDNYKNIQSTQ